MAEPTNKSPEINNLLDSITKRVSGLGRTEAITSDKCVWCGQAATEFEDELSRKEYSISGMCQECQDETFGDNNE